MVDIRSNYSHSSSQAGNITQLYLCLMLLHVDSIRAGVSRFPGIYRKKATGAARQLANIKSVTKYKVKTNIHNIST